ncbi:MAG TPA: bifunctional nuclease family protein [Acidobacteriota bacterium]|nr:bifunctional nuclease family protein [Acidobacteriota bacterium]HOS99794.1 bifunctional nuclease family protein [Acidobacteriota bacterium]HQF87144.1 bifunctional nuclease family protein [Acidobacteriota bacterium]HQG91705.1 bifunctional nuclease family protein [Acidobacteriota bacterium]HQK89082.1 bifunctional nuclease family protein [Acidobacteriota bacterium]
MDKIRQIEFFIKGLILDPVNNSPVVILQDTAETTVLPIWIGVFEANAIALEMEHIEAPRPMTHDLIRSILSKLSAVLEKVVITDLVDSTYYAELHIRFNNQLQVVDSRPSDALAVAIRVGAPVYVSEDVIRKSRSFSIADKQQWSEDDLKKWLEGLSPEDLGQYKM